MSKPTNQYLSIGEVAKAINVTRRIILNYEDKGLIQADVKEGTHGNRYYSADTTYTHYPHSSKPRTLLG